MVIDTHVHVLNTKAPAPDYFRQGGMDATVETLLFEMDRAGVDKAFLISYGAEDIAAEFRAQGRDPKGLAQVYSKDYAVQCWQAHRDRLWWFTDHVDPMDEKAAEKLERDLDAGAVGVKLLPVFRGALPNHPGFLPVYRLCQRRGVPVILDLSFWYVGVYPLYNTSEEEQEQAKTFEGYAALLDPIFDQFRSVRFQLAHCGAANFWEGAGGGEAVFNAERLRPVIQLVRRHPNLSVDLAAMRPDPAFLRSLIEGVGAEKVAFGSDWPYFGRSPERYRQLWSVVENEALGLSPAEREMLLSGNALAFVGGG